MNLVRGWRPEYFVKSTFLTDAVVSRKQGIVAILLFHGADPEQICPQSLNLPWRDSFCAFDDAFIFQINGGITSMPWILCMEYGLERNKCMQMIICMALMWMPLVYQHWYTARAHARTPTMREHTSPRTHACPHRTVFMQAVCSNVPFSVRWLVRNRNANIHVKNSTHKKMQWSFPCRPTPRNCELHKTIKNQSMTNTI